MFGQLPFDLMFLMMLYAAGTVMATIACLSHFYYEIIRADTTSEATREYYKKLCIEYHSHFDPDYVD